MIVLPDTSTFDSSIRLVTPPTSCHQSKYAKGVRQARHVC